MKFTSLIISLSLLLVATPTLAGTLSVPFTSQAPDADWREPWQNACEEAVLVMVNNYYNGTSLNRDQARSQILEVITQKEKMYGASFDENVNQIAAIANTYSPFTTEVVENPTVDFIKKEIDAGHPVIVPVYSSQFNPNFRTANPFHHVIVISGYDEGRQEFISQEPGTRFGENYRYSYSHVMNAIHDFVPGNSDGGRKAIIVTRGQVTKVITPPKPVESIPELSIIKSTDSPKLFLYTNGEKQYISSLAILQANASKWNSTVILSQQKLDSIHQGPNVK